jgi:hypothetical protein
MRRLVDRNKTFYGCLTRDNLKNLLYEIGEGFLYLKFEFDDYYGEHRVSWMEEESEHDERERLEKEAKDVIRKEQEELRELARLKKKYNK